MRARAYYFVAFFVGGGNLPLWLNRFVIGWKQMEAPWVRVCPKPSKIAFGKQPPRLVRWGFHPSSCNPLMIGVTESGALCRIGFARGRDAAAILGEWKKAWPKTEFVRDAKTTARIARQISGDAAPSALKVQMTGTDFQQKVWKELLKVRAGETVSYAELARRVKKPKAMRAVGAAMGANPVPILVPCHRVVASDGTLGGFGGGLGLKRQLLEAEGAKAA